MPLCTRQLLLTAALLRPAAAPVTRATGCAYHDRTASPAFAKRRTPSRRREKKQRPSPSKVIASALEDNGLHRNAPPLRHPRKVDLSHVNWKSDCKDWKRETSIFRQKSRREGNGRPDDAHPTTLQHIVASKIRSRFAQPDTDGVRNEPASFTPEELELLASRRYNRHDVDDWVSILSDRNAERAARAVLEHDASALDTEPRRRKPLPAFVFLFLLRRSEQSFTSKALRFALTHAWNELHRKHVAHLHATEATVDVQDLKACRLDYPTMSDSSVMIMVVRLLRLARHVAPEALITMASMFTRTFRLSSASDGSSATTIRLRRKKSLTLARLNAQYNRVLDLIALPAPRAPFLSTQYSQRAQFDILRAMAEHSPPLTITREGYRAVVQVHLAAKKTERERDWDALKAKSWPPWKEDRTGLDADKGPEYGISTALRALRHATNAGYALGAWERVAHILTGWDLDGSPVIQTRALLLHKYVSQQQLLQRYKTMDDSTENTPAAWAARIKATRTIQEAWACFLMHQDVTLKQAGSAKPSALVYHAMFEKLSAGTIGATNNDQFEDDPSLAPLSGGDTKEVLPTPTSPKEATYVRLEPPTLDALANEMFTMGINPGIPTLALLVSRAQSLAQGIKYLKWAALHDPRLTALLSRSPEHEKQLKDIPRPIFTAYLKLLCLYSSSRLDDEPPDASNETAVAFAQRLLQAYRPGNRVPYHVVLRRLAFNKRPSGSDTARLAMSKTAIESYFVMQQIIQHMQSMGIAMDSGTFRIQCSGLESAIFAALDVLENPHLQEQPNVAIPISSYPRAHDEPGSIQTQNIRSVADEILRNSAMNIRKLFIEVMDDSIPNAGPSESSKQTHKTAEDLPRLLKAPEPIIIHYYIRVLGLLRDYQGLTALVEWMCTYKTEVEAAAAGPRGGKLLLRRCFVALRVFVERAWIDHGEGIDDGRLALTQGNAPRDLAAPKQTRLRIKALVEELGWGQWPDDDEVEAYVSGGKFPNTRA